MPVSSASQAQLQKDWLLEHYYAKSGGDATRVHNSSSVAAVMQRRKDKREGAGCFAWQRSEYARAGKIVIYYFSLSMKTAFTGNCFVHNKGKTCCHNEKVNQQRVKRLVGVCQRRGESLVSLFRDPKPLCLLLKVISCLRCYFFPSLYPGPSSCTLPCWPLLHIAALSNLANACDDPSQSAPPGGRGRGGRGDTSGQAKRF